GALANSATHHVTDPYTVVPVAQPARPVYQSDHAAGGQIGGRAMLAPGELPGDRGAQRAPARGDLLEPTNPGQPDLSGHRERSWTTPAGHPARKGPAHGAGGG